ncbi:hypothetical protein HYR54_01465 [Candidatus Acetothermia bacterium]|nr:hypothetical protein [Candidatus Acetothermia bacterium]
MRKAFAFSFEHDKFVHDFHLDKAISPATPDVKGLPYRDPNIKGISLDHEKARAAFAAAKCGTAADAKPITQTGFTFTIRYNTGGLERQAAAILFKAGVESYNSNFHVNVEGVPFAEFLNEIADGTLPGFVSGWFPDYIDDADYIDQWMGSAAHGAVYSGPMSIDKLTEWGKAGTTPGGVSYATWDDLLNQGISSIEPKVRRDIYSHLQKLYVDNAIGIPVSQATAYFIQRTWLDGWFYNPSTTFPPLNLLSKKDDAKPNVEELCKNYPTTTFNFGGSPVVKKDCTNRP